MVKVPRFAFEKFPGADPTLTTHMKSVGEAMASGGNFTEALQKALRSHRAEGAEFSWPAPTRASIEDAAARDVARPHDGRLLRGAAGVAAGRHAWRQLHEATGIDPWFLEQIAG